ncbi:MAG: geranylgeranylglycerol-phosphate geranylgeranyltransferase [Chitinophagaceae bacterium]|nr:geranylgeranylglycerol-phosphate geranylgeranyltransferase [Chitinophagaceae bacterium]
MSKIKAAFTLIRFPNLVFILLTQVLARFFIIDPAIKERGLSAVLDTPHFYLLCLSTVLIAAAGYIINDYFDIGIDAINKPHKVTIEKIFKRRTIIIWHISLNLAAMLIVIGLTLSLLQLRLVAIQLVSILLLIFYSTTFKRKLIIGNLCIGVLTGLTLLTVAFYEPAFELFNTDFLHSKLLWMYVLFSFIITFIREVVKDIEDVKGDTAQNCETIPLVWGIDNAKKIVYVFMILLLMLLLITTYYFFSFNKVLVIYLFAAVFVPVIFTLYKTRQASHSADFNRISTYVKIVTLLGILSITLI